jgi:two-component system sensor histidine kinase RpfC
VGVDRPELEQFVLRVGIAAAVMLYLFWYSWRDGVVDSSEFATLWVSVGFFLFGLGMIAIILTFRGVSVVRRYVAIVADNAVTTFCLSQMGEGGVVVIGAYLFITFGNGFRTAGGICTYARLSPLQGLPTCWRHRSFGRSTYRSAWVS